MRLEQFQYVVEIAHCKSMSKASKKLYITQPSLSTSIQNFEDELGFQIFKRSSQGVTLTDKGEALLAIAENIVQHLEEVKELSNPDHELNSSVALAAVPVVCNALIINLIDQLRCQEHSINLQIHELRPCKILPSLLSGASDLALGTYSPGTKEAILQEASRAGLILEPIFEDCMYAFLHRNHPLATESAIAVSDLANDTPIFFNDHTLMDHDGSCATETEMTSHYYSFTDRSSIKQAITKGLGYAILPRLMAMDDVYVNSGMIVALPLTDTDIGLTTFLAYSGKHSLSKAEKQIIQNIKQLYQDIDQKIKSRTDQLQNKCGASHNNLIFY